VLVVLALLLAEPALDVPPYAVLATLGLAFAGARATNDLWEPSDHVGGSTPTAAQHAADQVESALGAAAWVLLVAGVAATVPGVRGSLPLAILIILAIPATWMIAQRWVKRARVPRATPDPPGSSRTTER